MIQHTVSWLITALIKLIFYFATVYTFFVKMQAKRYNNFSTHFSCLTFSFNAQNSEKNYSY